MPSGYGFNDIGRSGDLKQSYLNLANRANVFNSANKIALSQERVRESMFTKRLEEDKNYKLNSLKGLFVQSGDDLNTASLKANSFFSRIDTASSTQELNSVYDELSQIRDKAALNNRVFYKGDKDAGLLTDSLQGLAKSATNLIGTLGAGLSELTGGFLTTEISKTKNNLKEELKKSNPNPEALTSYFRGSDENDFFNTIKGHINQSKNAQFGNNYVNKVGDVATLKKQLQSAINNPNKRAGLLDLKNSYLDNEFTTKGSDFYREGEEVQNFQKRAKDSLYNPQQTDVNERYFNYDLENNALGSLKNTLNKKLNETWNKFIKNEKGQWVRDEKALKDIRDSLSLIDQRQSQLSEAYSVNKNEKTWDSLFTKGREGSYAGSFYSGLKPFTSAVSQKLGLSDDFENTIEQKALYLPKQVDYDREGNAVMSNQLFYTKKDGSSGVNGGAVLELGLQQVGQMLPTIILSEVGGAALGRLGASAATAEAGIAAGTLSKTALSEVSALSRAANTFSKGYDRFNKVGAAGTEFKLADRVSTAVNVFATTYPMIEAEERKYGGNYKERARWKTSIESFVEAAGFPDVGALKMRPMQTSMVGDAARAAGKTIKEIPFTDRLRMYYNTSKEFGKLTFKQNLTESLEEEMSLIGNYLYESMNSEEFKDREQTRLNAESLTDTFVDSFVGGLLYSSGTTSFGVYKFTRNDNLQQMADWNAANNPELMKAKIAEMHTSGKLTEEQTSKAINRVNELQAVLKSSFGLSELKDAKSRLEDKDAQFEYFQNIVKRADLVGLDFDSMTDEEKELFADKRKKEKISRKTGKRIDEIKVELAELKLNEENATEEDQKKVETLNEELSKLSFIKKGMFNKSTLSAEQIKYLQEKELLPEEKPLSKEDFDKEIAAVDASILKTKKRVDKYVNLSKEEKQKVLDSSYDEQIEAIGQVNSPNKILNSYIQVSNLLDEYEKTGKDFEELDKKNAEKLKNAYSQRFEDLVNARNERGYNAVEESLFAIDAQAFLENNDLNGLLALNDTLLEEADYIGKSFADQIKAKNYLLYTAMMNKVNKMSSEERIDFLADFLDKNSHKTVIPTFEIDALNKVFSQSGQVKVEFTEEELSAARDKMLESRGRQRANALVNKGAVVEDANLTPEEIEDKKDFKKDLKDFIEVDKNESVDESGKSSFQDLLSEKYNAQKEKSKKIAGEDWRDHFIQFYVNQIGNYFGRKVAAFTQAGALSRQLFNGEITLDQFNKSWNAFGQSINNSMSKLDPKSNAYKNLEEKKAALKAFRDYINKLYTEDLPENFELKVKSKEETKVEKEEQKSNISFLDTVAEARHKENMLRAETRKERLLSLATPARSNGIELIYGERSSDPVDLRRLRAIDELAQVQDVKVRLMSKQQFLKQHISEKFPEASKEEVEAMFNVIVDTFNTINTKGDSLTLLELEDSLKPVYDVLGEGFMSTREIMYYSKNPKDLVEKNTPIMAAVAEGKLFQFEGFPVELSLYGKLKPSERVSTALEELSISEEDVKERHKNNHASLLFIADAIAKNPSKTFDFKYEVTAGVVPTNEKEVSSLGLTYEPIVTINLDSSGIQQEDLVKNNLAIATSVNDRVFGKSFVFYPGRLYFNYKGNPVQLNNMRMDSAEAQALVELMFRPAEQEQSLDYFSIFKNPEAFENYLRNLINQVDSNDRIYFIKNNKFGQPGEPAIIVKRVQVVGSKRTYFTLTPKETLDFLNKSYYKVDKTLLEDNNVMPRFSMQEGEILVDDESSYVNYVFQTHEMPMVAGKPYSLVNKTVMLNEEDLQNTGKTLGVALQKQTPTPPAVVKTPPPAPKTTTTSFVDKDGYEIVHNEVADDRTILTDFLYFPSRQESIAILKANNAKINFITDLENMTDLEYYAEVKNLGTKGFNTPAVKQSNKQPKRREKGLMKSFKGDMVVIEVAPGVNRLYGLADANSGKYVIKYTLNRSRANLTTEQLDDPSVKAKVEAAPVLNRVFGVKGVPESPATEEEEWGTIEDMPNVFPGKTPTPVPTVQETSTIKDRKADIEKRRREGTNSRGTTYKGETTEKDGLKITKYSEFKPDGKRISKGGRIMTLSEFIKEYSITDQDHLDSLEGATEIRIYEVRVGKDTTGIDIQGTFPEGNLDVTVAGKELTALETSQETELSKEPSTSIANPFIEFTNDVDSKEAEETKEDCKGPSTAPKSLADRLNQNTSPADSKAIKGDEQKTTRRPRK